MSQTKTGTAALLAALTVLAALIAAVPAQAVYKKKAIWLTLPSGESAFPTMYDPLGVDILQLQLAG